MRTVAERADVALGTLYRYFPSKIHLLVSALARELERVQDRSERVNIPGDTPFDRLMFMLARITKGLRRDPQLSFRATPSSDGISRRLRANGSGSGTWLASLARE